MIPKKHVESSMNVNIVELMFCAIDWMMRLLLHYSMSLAML